MKKPSFEARALGHLVHQSGVGHPTNVVAVAQGPITRWRVPNFFVIGERGTPEALNAAKVAARLAGNETKKTMATGLDREVADDIQRRRARLIVLVRSPGGLPPRATYAIAEVIKNSPLNMIHSFAAGQAASQGGRLWILGDTRYTTDDSYHMWHAGRHEGVKRVFNTAATLKKEDELHQRQMRDFFRQSNDLRANALRMKLERGELDERATIELKGKELAEMGLARSFPTVREMADSFRALSGWTGNPGVSAEARPSATDQLEVFWQAAIHGFGPTAEEKLAAMSIHTGLY